MSVKTPSSRKSDLRLVMVLPLTHLPLLVLLQLVTRLTPMLHLMPIRMLGIAELKLLTLCKIGMLTKTRESFCSP